MAVDWAWRGRSRRLPAGGVGAADTTWIKVAVLGFLSRSDEELYVTCRHWSWMDCQVSEGSAGEFQMDDLPGVFRRGWCFGHTQPCFFPTVWFQRGRCEALRSVAIMGHVLVPRWNQTQRMSWKSRTEDCQWRFVSWWCRDFDLVIYELKQRN
jgi:hypothetical protein